MNEAWLLEAADAPIRYILRQDTQDAGLMLKNAEVAGWLSRLEERARGEDIGAVHGSHDYRMENILGKCWILGLCKDIQPFADYMAFILRFLNRHIEATPPAGLSFEKLYHFRDYEKVLCCFLPLLGYDDEPSVGHIARRRIDVLYEFARQRRYDIYVDGSKLKGVKKEWQPYIINPDLYADGHIALPDMHDLLLLAGMYGRLDADDRRKVETIVQWLFGEGYGGIINRYGYFYAPGGAYDAKAVIFKPGLPDLQDGDVDKGELTPLLFSLLVMSHFESARGVQRFSLALRFLEQYRNEAGRYAFPPHMIVEKPDGYVIKGGHMNVGESPRGKAYREIISTYWMERIRGRKSWQHSAICTRSFGPAANGFI